MSSIVFLHNQSIHYRTPLFSLLKQHYRNEIEFWFYHEDEPTFYGKYFRFIKYPVKFSFEAIYHLWREPFEFLVLAGSHSWELPFFFLIAKLRHKKVVFWTETWNWDSMDLKNRFFLLLISYIAKRADSVIYPGKRVQSLYQSLDIASNIMFHAPNTSVVPKMCHNPLLLPAIGENKRTIGYAARIVPRKGLMILLSSISKLRGIDVELLVTGIGEGDYYNKCVNKMSTFPNVHFLGPFQPAQLSRFFEKLDVFVYPSLTLDGMAEPWGLTINELLEFCIPTVTTKAVAAADDLIVDGVNGYVVDEGSSDAMARGIVKALQLERSRVATTNKKLLETYNYKKMSEGFINAITSVMK